MIRTTLMLEIGKDRLPEPGPADMAMAKLLGLLPVKLWGCVPDVVNNRFVRSSNGIAGDAEREFNTHCTLNLYDISEAVKSVQALKMSSSSTGLAADTLRLEQFAQKVHDSVRDLNAASALLIDTATYRQFIELCTANNALVAYTGRVAYQVGYEEGLKAGMAAKERKKIQCR